MAAAGASTTTATTAAFSPQIPSFFSPLSPSPSIYTRSCPFFSSISKHHHHNPISQSKPISLSLKPTTYIITPLISILRTHNHHRRSSTSPPNPGQSSISSAADSLFVLCTSLALSFSLFTATVDPASAFVVNTPRKLQSDELATVRLFQENTPSVVYITNLAAKQDAFTLDVLEVPQGSGSGFIWDKDGHIVTNYHVIRGASDLRVTLADQTTYDAKVVGFDQDKDVAVLHIDAPEDKLRPLPVGISEDLLVGQKVYAIGNPFGLDHTLTTGVISFLI